MAKKKQEQQPLVPKSRFPEFEGDGEWGEMPLSNLSTRIRRKVGAKKLTPVSITAGVGFVDQAEKFGRRIAGAQYKNYIHIRRGDFVYNKGNSKTFPQGCIYQLREFDEAAASTAFICFRLNESCVGRYFQSLFECNTHGRKLLKFITSGARSDGLLNINPTDFFSIELPLPPCSLEQQKIADCLGSLDDLIAAHSAKLDALQDHKKGLLQQLFPAEGQTTPALRFPEFEDAGEWQETTFGEAAAFLNGRAYKKKELLRDGRYRVLRVGNFFTNSEWYYSNLELDESKYCVNGDLLYAWSASFGPQFWAGEKAIYHYHIWKIVPKGQVQKHFLFWCLENATQKMKADAANGLGLLHITKRTIESWRCLLPRRSEQKRIADCLGALNALISAEADQIAALKEHKKGLMQQLFPNPELSKA